MCRFTKLLLFFCPVRMAMNDWWNGPLTFDVNFFALCFMLVTWSIAGVACCVCSSGNFFHWDTPTPTLTHTYALTCTYAAVRNLAETRAYIHNRPRNVFSKRWPLCLLQLACKCVLFLPHISHFYPCFKTFFDGWLSCHSGGRHSLKRKLNFPNIW